MNVSLHRRLNRRKRRVLRRLEDRPGVERPEPMMASNIHYELADKAWAIDPAASGRSTPIRVGLRPRGAAQITLVFRITMSLILK